VYTHMGEMRNAYKFWSECLKEGDHLGDLGVHERILLKLIFEK
jgi:hypothetical protein